MKNNWIHRLARKEAFTFPEAAALGGIPTSVVAGAHPFISKSIEKKSLEDQKKIYKDGAGDYGYGAAGATLGLLAGLNVNTQLPKGTPIGTRAISGGVLGTVVAAPWITHQVLRNRRKKAIQKRVAEAKGLPKASSLSRSSKRSAGVAAGVGGAGLAYLLYRALNKRR